MVGATDGVLVGEGLLLGLPVGAKVGGVGVLLGALVGALVGALFGALVGALVGEDVGAAVITHPFTIVELIDTHPIKGPWFTRFATNSVSKNCTLRWHNWNPSRYKSPLSTRQCPSM